MLHYDLLNQYDSQYKFPLVDGQTGFVLFPAKTCDEGVHTDIIAEDVVKHQVQGMRQMQRHLKRFFLCPSSDSQVPYFLGNCEAHCPSSFFDEITR